MLTKHLRYWQVSQALEVLECLLAKCHVLKSWSPACGTLRGGQYGGTLRRSLVKGSYIIWAVEEDIATPPFPSPHLSLLPGHHEVNKFPLLCTFTIIYCLKTGPKATWPNDHELKPLRS
jgi:hypothetical protein